MSSGNHARRSERHGRTSERRLSLDEDSESSNDELPVFDGDQRRPNPTALFPRTERLSASSLRHPAHQLAAEGGSKLPSSVEHLLKISPLGGFDACRRFLLESRESLVEKSIAQQLFAQATQSVVRGDDKAAKNCIEKALIIQICCANPGASKWAKYFNELRDKDSKASQNLRELQAARWKSCQECAHELRATTTNDRFASPGHARQGSKTSGQAVDVHLRHQTAQTSQSRKAAERVAARHGEDSEDDKEQPLPDFQTLQIDRTPSGPGQWQYEQPGAKTGHGQRSQHRHRGSDVVNSQHGRHIPVAPSLSSGFKYETPNATSRTRHDPRAPENPEHPDSGGHGWSPSADKRHDPRRPDKPEYPDSGGHGLSSPLGNDYHGYRSPSSKDAHVFSSPPNVSAHGFSSPPTSPLETPGPMKRPGHRRQSHASQRHAEVEPEPADTLIIPHTSIPRANVLHKEGSGFHRRTASEAGKILTVGRVISVIEYLPFTGDEKKFRETPEAWLIKDNRGGWIISHESLYVVVKTSSLHGRCWAIAISTYGKQGLRKSGLNHKDVQGHAIIYSGRKVPQLLSQEPGMDKQPIAVNCELNEELHEASRVNFKKVSTIEHNVSFKIIGKVAQNSISDLKQYWREEVEELQQSPTANQLLKQKNRHGK